MTDVDERPFTRECHVCGSAFNSRSLYYGHLMAHPGRSDTEYAAAIMAVGFDKVREIILDPKKAPSGSVTIVFEEDEPSEAAQAISRAIEALADIAPLATLNEVSEAIFDTSDMEAPEAEQPPPKATKATARPRKGRATRRGKVAIAQS